MKTIHGDMLGASGAVFSDDGRYRYLLWRAFVPKPGNWLHFVMLNPSTADAFRLDPTVTRCVAFAKAWGHDGLRVTNLYAYRATDPAAMLKVDDPIGGPENVNAIVSAALMSERTIVAWGAWPATHFTVGHKGTALRSHAERLRRLREHPLVVLRALREAVGNVYALKFTKARHPQHPLYVAAATVPVLYAPSEAS